MTRHTLNGKAAGRYTCGMWMTDQHRVEVKKVGAGPSRCDQKVPASRLMITPGNVGPRFGSELVLTSSGSSEDLRKAFLDWPAMANPSASSRVLTRTAAATAIRGGTADRRSIRRPREPGSGRPRRTARRSQSPGYPPASVVSER